MVNQLGTLNPASPGVHRERWMHPGRSLVAAALVLSGLAPACQSYDPPPEPSIVGLEEGKLSDETQPLLLQFDEPVKPDTLKVKIAKYSVDAEGNLPDEDTNAMSTLEVFFQHDPGKDELGTSELLDGNRTLKITPTAPFPVGPQLVLIIEKGLSDVEGNATAVRNYILFGYGFTVACGKPVTAIASSKMYYLFEFVKPLPTQAQLFADLRIDPDTGAFTGSFTNADRNPDPNRCNPPCGPMEVCRLLPTQACVVPSEKATSPDDFSDFVVNTTPPTGFVFSVTGCMQEEADGKVYFLSDPFELVVEQPAIRLVGGITTGTISVDGSGIQRVEGSATAEEVFLGTTPTGKGESLVLGRSITDAEAPPDIPAAPPLP